MSFRLGYMEDFFQCWETRFKIVGKAYEYLEYAIKLEDLGKKELTKEEKRNEKMQNLRKGILSLTLASFSFKGHAKPSRSMESPR